jgi:predicted nucleic acid-binding protein
VIVVDTNIMAYRWLPGPRSQLIGSLLRVDSEWAAPLLWRSEFRNILAGLLRAGKLTLHEANLTMQHAALSLSAGEHIVQDQAVLTLVSQSHCTAYDCEFVALANALDTMLVTEDKAVIAAFPNHCRSLTGFLTASK